MQWSKLREKAFSFTKKALRDSVGDDQLIVQTISAIEELDRTANLLSRRVREWYEWYAPEISRKYSDHDVFVKKILEVKRVSEMGADLTKKDVDQILQLASFVGKVYGEREALEKYLTGVMQSHCPNMLAVSGATIGAKLLREAGSLKKLATIQSSTIQLYGAEKALFRHIKTGAKPPKYGHIIHHPLIMGAKEKGKAARALADKLSICCKVDYFKGEFVGDELRRGLEERFL